MNTETMKYNDSVCCFHYSGYMTDMEKPQRTGESQRDLS